MKTSPILGIDFGTTHAVMSAVVNGRAEIIPNVEGERTTPTVLAVKRGEVFIGTLAKKQHLTNPTNTFHLVKRLLGKSLGDLSGETVYLPYSISPSSSGECSIHLEQRELLPEQIMALIFQKLKKDAEKHLKTPIDQVVLTYPVAFIEHQKEKLKVVCHQSDTEK